MRTWRTVVASSNADRRGELRASLELERHCVVEVTTAAKTIQTSCAESYDLLVMNSVVDGIAAYELCRAIRPQSGIGIIVCGEGGIGSTAIDALNAGADDYVSTPFIPAELLARVRALLRRVKRPGDGDGQIVLQDRAIDLRSHKIKGPGSNVANLTPKEFLVLQHLVAHADKPLTHQTLAQSVWQRDGGGEVEYMRIIIKQLRRKIEADPEHPRYIRTERAVGYRFHMPGADTNALAEFPNALPLAG